MRISKPSERSLNAARRFYFGGAINAGLDKHCDEREKNDASIREQIEFAAKVADALCETIELKLTESEKVSNKYELEMWKNDKRASDSERKVRILEAIVDRMKCALERISQTVHTHRGIPNEKWCPRCQAESALIEVNNLEKQNDLQNL